MAKLKISDTERKTLSFLIGVIMVAYGITNISNNFWSIIVIFLGVYLVIKGLE